MGTLALGITVHTGWGACVMIARCEGHIEIVENKIVSLATDADRFCYHRAADMELREAERWLAERYGSTVKKGREFLDPLLKRGVFACGVVAKAGRRGEVVDILRSHACMHAAEGFFYRDVFLEICRSKGTAIEPSSLNPAAIERFAVSPWRRDQKLATLAALSVIA